MPETCESGASVTAPSRRPRPQAEGVPGLVAGERRWRNRFDRIDSPNQIFASDSTAVKTSYHIVNREENTRLPLSSSSQASTAIIVAPGGTDCTCPDRRRRGNRRRRASDHRDDLDPECHRSRRWPDTRSGDMLWLGSQGGRLMLADRQLKVKRPRLRHREQDEVKCPAYEAPGRE